MHKTKEQLYKEIKDLISKDEFEKEIKKIKDEYDDLLDDDTIALLIVDKLGRNKQNIIKINELEPENECTIIGKITKINNSRNFNRKNGSMGQVINLEISDETGKCGLALWDKDVELVKNKTIKLGTNLKIINGYTKDGFKGLEINVGRWGLLELDTDNETEQKQDETKLKGKIIFIEPTRAFFKDDGEFGFVTNIKLDTINELKQITIWGDKVKEIQKFKAGDNIEINNISIKKNNDKEEIHLNSKGTIKKV